MRPNSSEIPTAREEHRAGRGEGHRLDAAPLFFYFFFFFRSAIRAETETSSTCQSRPNIGPNIWRMA